MADDDDDEGFGDFKFAPMAPIHATNTTATVTVDTNPKTSSGDFFSDDDWGDFVTTRSDQINGGFELSNGAAIQSSINQKPLNLFGNSVDDNESVLNRVESVPTRVESVRAQWVKPQGAIPLSLFGETEEEEENSGAGEPAVGDGAVSLFHKNGDNGIKGSALNGGVGINDLIANLYNQSPRIKVENGSYPNSTSNGANPKSNDSSANVDGLGSNTSAFNWHPNGFDSIFQDTDPNSNNLDSNGGGMSSDLVEGSQNFDDGDEDDDDDDGWEFKGADADKQGQRVVELPVPKVETVARKDQEFKAVPNLKVDTGGMLNVEESVTLNEYGDGAHGPETQSDESHHKGGDWNSMFDFNPSSATTNDLLWDSYSRSEKNNTEIGSNLSTVIEHGNSDENFWQFRDAFSKVGPEPMLEAGKVATPADLGGQALIGDGAHDSSDFFAASKDTLPNTGEWDFAFTLNSSSTTEDGISNLHSSSKKNDTRNGPRSSADDEHDESGDNSWDFQDAFSEPVSKHEGESVVAPDLTSNMIPPVLDGVNQRNDVKSESHRKALPLSIFGDEELENDPSQAQEDVSTNKPTSYPSYSTKAPGSNLSINDLISSLYIQSENNTPVNDTPKVSENGMATTMRALESDLVDHDDDFEDDAWEFKDAFLDTKAQNQTFVSHVEDSQSSAKLRLEDFVNFYSKLKDDSCFVALSHFENLKKAQSSTTLGDEARLKALGEEIQKISNQPCEDNMISEFESHNLSARTVRFIELLEVLQEPKFRVLESEYQLSNQLSLAETDLGSAIELSKHAVSTLRILKLGSAEEQYSYVSTWSKVVSVCAQELRHGAFIWKQSLQKDVHSQILSEPRGRQYIIGLAEIYRVVQVLAASSQLYKPWVLLDSEESARLFTLLNECTTLWSTSGLDEALQSISQQFDSEYGATSKALLESMKYMNDLDALALQSHVFSGEQPICRLSMLTAGIVPGIEIVVWDGDHYLLKLANLWANLISSSPPDMPRLNEGIRNELRLPGYGMVAKFERLERHQ
ncbi:hypothetical protein TorRG33x02_332410 [Trema orientale]|uniref:Synergin gamma C-terminal domain-containing protein n=1 Tax=Trema orientale TaxID=63057 RepID=A0A2P5B584_TREOI|nr:hypothetical protein TorRG33x02_332410 [Trema orientale]